MILIEKETFALFLPQIFIGGRPNSL